MVDAYDRPVAHWWLEVPAQAGELRRRLCHRCGVLEVFAEGTIEHIDVKVTIA